MNKNIELEYKSLLTKEQFDHIKSLFAFSEPFKQVNHYFDTKDKQMKERRSPLRIREVDNKLIMTIKTPNKIGVNEFECEVESLDFSSNKISNDILQAMYPVTPNEVYEFGSLTTYRRTFETELATICLDENFYADCHDYEIEYEVKKEHNSLDTFKKIMAKCGIPSPRPAKGKTARFRDAIKF